MIIVRFVWLMMGIMMFLASIICNETVQILKEYEQDRKYAIMFRIIYYLVLTMSTFCFIQSIM